MPNDTHLPPEWAAAPPPEFASDPHSFPMGVAPDPLTGEVWTLRNPDGSWAEFVRDEFGRVLAFRSSSGYWQEFVRDPRGNVVRYRNSSGFWSETERLRNGQEIFYRDSVGVVRYGATLQAA